MQSVWILMRHVQDSFWIKYSSCICESRMGKKMMIIGVETLSKILDWSDRSTCVLFGDGADAQSWKRMKKEKSLSMQRSDGARGDVLTCEERHLNNLLVKDDSPMQQVAMDGRKYSNLRHVWCQRVLTKSLMKRGVSKEEIKYFVLHQANKRIIEA